LYFLWTSFLAKWLILPGVIGTICFIVGYATTGYGVDIDEDDDTKYIIDMVFAGLMLIWCVAWEEA